MFFNINVLETSDVLNNKSVERLECRSYCYSKHCLLYTSDAADEGLGVDLGGRRIIKK